MCPESQRQRKRGKGKERYDKKIREQVSPPSALAAVSELVVGILRCWARAGRGWPPPILYPLGTCLTASRKFLKMSRWMWGGVGGLGGLADHPLVRLVTALCKCLTSLPTSHFREGEVSFASRHPASTGFRSSSCSLTKMRKFPKCNA